MTEEKTDKLLITHGDLQDPKVDEKLEKIRATKAAIARVAAVEKPSVINFVYKHWLALFIAAIIASLFVLGIIWLINPEKKLPNTPKEEDDTLVVYNTISNDFQYDTSRMNTKYHMDNLDNINNPKFNRMLSRIDSIYTRNHQRSNKNNV